jgi:hypothetical protein
MNFTRIKFSIALESVRNKKEQHEEEILRPEKKVRD